MAVVTGGSRGIGRLGPAGFLLARAASSFATGVIIRVDGVLTDEGFTKDPQLVNTAKVFTAWCNAAGGIDGHKLVADIHDTGMLDVVGAMSQACGSDFVLAGGSAALDGLGVSARLKCLLPDFDAQVVMPQNNGSGIQIYPIPWSHAYSVYSGYYTWLIKQKYPDSANAVGIVSGASVITQYDDSPCCTAWTSPSPRARWSPCSGRTERASRIPDFGTSFVVLPREACRAHLG